MRATALLHDIDPILAGRAIRPGDTDYDAARGPAAIAADQRPAVIVRAANISDVTLAIELARSADLELAVRGGGHSLAGHSMTDGGILLDLGDMREMWVYPEQHMAWADAGLTAGEFTRTAAAHGLATGFGDTASVGIAGLTLGGGIGWMVRKHGLTIDNLVAADIVTADGEYLPVSATKHPDLFWALRGGGGNFGVVTRFAFRLHPVATVLGGLLVLPATPEVVHGFVAAAEAAPDDLTTIAHLAPAPPMPLIPAERHGQLALMVSLVHAGDPTRASRDIAPMRALAEPIADTVRPMVYPKVYDLPTTAPHGGPAAMRSTFVDEIDADGAATMIEQMQRAPSGRAMTQIRVLGGAVASVPPDVTAFAHRRRRAMVTVATSHGEGSGGIAEDAWAMETIDALPGSGRGVYANFLRDEGSERVREAYPDGTYERLAAIKARYDPTNLFRRNANVEPVRGGAW